MSREPEVEEGGAGQEEQHMFVVPAAPCNYPEASETWTQVSHGKRGELFLCN